MKPPPLILRRLGEVDYATALERMRDFTQQRTDATPDELWLLQHPAVFTQGQAGRSEHLLATGEIPVVQVDRGGQVTYHGPGQWVVYLMIDLRRRTYGVRVLVERMEKAVVATLRHYGIDAAPDAARPGVYVRGKKIASLGLRVRRGCSYHGLALNVDMDLAPFQRINPCGHAGLEVTSMARLLPEHELVMDDVGERLIGRLQLELGR
ncbi:lipoyl(octanoyl) transferase LipB [Chromatocurvus halotolerans]|uniref:Octanoyltransferase n=1 Tax=Chromatocurvus halotolerans TaxID=1132028 RepID=A0A4R2KTV5_9GAMM|nr:lipoyl(octanoyl) transferase LipB [Chromatocurvus halotolerans]TCO77284.1 lipoyl(octanoyl) transferase [Chromatocurvus halotolerans]